MFEPILFTVLVKLIEGKKIKMTTTTEQKEKSKEKAILGEINNKTLNEFLYEFDNGKRKDLRLLEVAYDLAIKGNVSLIKLFIDKIYPTPRPLEITLDQKNEGFSNLSDEELDAILEKYNITARLQK